MFEPDSICANAYRRADPCYASPNRRSFPEGLLDLLGDGECIFPVGGLLTKQYCKLVTSKPCALGVARSRQDKALGHCRKQFVSSQMPVQVIDLFEVVEIQIYQGNIVAGAQFLFNSIGDTGAIQKARSVILDSDYIDFALRFNGGLRLQ